MIINSIKKRVASLTVGLHAGYWILDYRYTCLQSNIGLSRMGRFVGNRHF